MDYHRKSDLFERASWSRDEELSKESARFMPAQRFTGMQVIDSKGTMVGNVKDVSVDFRNKELAFRVTTKARTEIDLVWDDVLSVEDVVLLKKEIDIAVEPAGEPAPSVTSGPTVQAVLICPNCGASAPGHAKFCPRCGTSIR
jgi:sporulation protein YlmC with PRC-barrel domain